MTSVSSKGKGKGKAPPPLPKVGPPKSTFVAKDVKFIKHDWDAMDKWMTDKADHHDTAFGLEEDQIKDKIAAAEAVKGEGYVAETKKCPRCEKEIRVDSWESHWSSHSSDILGGWLYLGGRRNVENEAELTKRTAITHIVNVAAELFDILPLDSKGKFVEVSFPLRDGNAMDEQTLLLKAREAAKYVHDRHLEDANNHILVHCTQGVSRSASTIIVYLMEYENMTLRQAYEHTKKCRSVIDPRPNFVDELGKFEAQLINDGKIKIVEGTTKLPTLTSEETTAGRNFLNLDPNAANDDKFLASKTCKATEAQKEFENLGGLGIGSLKKTESTNKGGSSSSKG